MLEDIRYFFKLKKNRLSVFFTFKDTAFHKYMRKYFCSECYEIKVISNIFHCNHVSQTSPQTPPKVKFILKVGIASQTYSYRSLAWEPLTYEGWPPGRPAWKRYGPARWPDRVPESLKSGSDSDIFETRDTFKSDYTRLQGSAHDVTGKPCMKTDTNKRHVFPFYRKLFTFGKYVCF